MKNIIDNLTNQKVSKKQIKKDIKEVVNILEEAKRKEENNKRLALFSNFSTINSINIIRS